MGGQALTRVPCGKCLSGAAGGGHSNLLTLFSGAALDSCVCPVPENVFLAFRFRFWSQNTIFFCVRVVTHVDFCPKHVPVEYSVFHAYGAS